MKKGLEFFYYPTVNDRRTDHLLAVFGAVGLGILTALYQRIYREEGYFCVWDDVSADIFAYEAHSDRETVNKIVRFAVEKDIFSKKMFDEQSILTSEEIQEHFFTAIKRRKDLRVKTDYIISETAKDTISSFTEKKSTRKEQANSYPEKQNVSKNEKNVYINQENVCKSEENACIFEQSKGKESKEKEKETKEDQSILKESIKEERKLSLPSGERVKEKDSASQSGATASPLSHKNVHFIEGKIFFGMHQNVSLTVGEYEMIKSIIPEPEAYINMYADKIAKNNYAYSNHLDTILSWWNKDRNLDKYQQKFNTQSKTNIESTYDLDKFVSLSVARGERYYEENVNKSG